MSADADWAEKSNEFNESLFKEMSEGKISDDEWFEINKLYFTKHYLASDNPKGQSGHDGNEHGYFHSHQLLIHVIHFLVEQ
ncbi:hypothetical protein [Paenibacillus sp. FSL H8-0034]|uniref:hypothetical protein n=1 Tax=Paenibacillus sp. FSL H8-0034 TaxID=2954671 RepID=UPI0030FCF4D0